MSEIGSTARTVDDLCTLLQGLLDDPLAEGDPEVEDVMAEEDTREMSQKEVEVPQLIDISEEDAYISIEETAINLYADGGDEDLFFGLEAYDQAEKEKEVRRGLEEYPQLCKTNTRTKSMVWGTFQVQAYDDRGRINREFQKQRPVMEEVIEEVPNTEFVDDDYIEDFVYKDRPRRGLAGVSIDQSSDEEDFTACLDSL